MREDGSFSPVFHALFLFAQQLIWLSLYIESHLSFLVLRLYDKIQEAVLCNLIIMVDFFYRYKFKY